MAVALKELERGHPRPRLRVVPGRLARPRRHVFWLRRMLAVAVLFGVLLVVLGGARAIGASRADGAQLTRTELTVVVEPGETLWQIAARYAPHDRDMVEWAAELARLNDVDPQALQAGTPLVVPLETVSVPAAPQPSFED